MPELTPFRRGRQQDRALGLPKLNERQGLPPAHPAAANQPAPRGRGQPQQRSAGGDDLDGNGNPEVECRPLRRAITDHTDAARIADPVPPEPRGQRQRCGGGLLRTLDRARLVPALQGLREAGGGLPPALLAL